MRTRRVAAVLTGLLGLSMIGGILLDRSVAKARAGDVLVDQAIAAVGGDALDLLRADTDQLQVGITQTTDEVLPALAQALGTTPDGMASLIEQRYPATAALLERRDEVLGALDKTVANLERNEVGLIAAGDLPGPGLPLAAAPVAALVLAGALIALSAAGWRRPDRRGSFVAVAVVGGSMVLGSLALQAPAKLADTERLVDSLDITEQTAGRAREQFDLTASALQEVRGALLPDVAGALGLSAEQLTEALAPQFPEAVATLGQADATLGRIEADVQFRERSIDEFALVRDVPLRAMGWAWLGLGAALAIIGGLATLERRHIVVELDDTTDAHSPTETDTLVPSHAGFAPSPTAGPDAPTMVHVMYRPGPDAPR